MPGRWASAAPESGARRRLGVRRHEITYHRPAGIGTDVVAKAT